MDEKWEVQPRTDLDHLVERAALGENVELTRDGKTVARIVPAETNPLGPPTWDELRTLRKGVRLPEGMTIRDLINDGRTPYAVRCGERALTARNGMTPWLHLNAWRPSSQSRSPR